MSNAPTRRELRSFGLVVGTAFAIIGALQLVFHGKLPPMPFFYVGGALVLLGLVLPSILRWPHFLWMKLALALGFVMNRVILAVIFFVLITFLGLVQRLIKRDRLHRGFTPAERRNPSESLWVLRKVTQPPPESYERQF